MEPFHAEADREPHRRVRRADKAAEVRRLRLRPARTRVVPGHLAGDLAEQFAARRLDGVDPGGPGQTAQPPRPVRITSGLEGGLECDRRNAVNGKHPQVRRSGEPPVFVPSATAKTGRDDLAAPAGQPVGEEALRPAELAHDLSDAVVAIAAVGSGRSRGRPTAKGSVSKAATAKLKTEALIHECGVKCSQPCTVVQRSTHQPTYPGLISW